MTDTVNRKDFIKIMAAKNGITQAEAEKQYDNYLAALEEAIGTKKVVLIGDLCRVQAYQRKGGMGINPATKAKEKRPDIPALKCRLSAQFSRKLEKLLGLK